jgi:polysaccharide chain length determinant protein (PEP-CTERM system associated)
MIPKEGIDLPYVREVLKRRFWYLALPFFLISLVLLLYCIFVPRVFTAHTVILVEPQKVPGEYVSSTVTIDLQGRLRTITQQIKSRTRLEKIINDYDLYPDIRESATMTDAVEEFQDNIEVTVRGGNSAFEVSFSGQDPVKVRDVTNTIANLFIEDNLKLRESQAAGTTMFLDRELEKLQQALEQKEAEIREFKERHSGYLPKDMNQNYRMMGLLQKQLDSLNATIQQTKDRKIVLESQLSNLRRMEAQFGGSTVPEPDPDASDAGGEQASTRIDTPALAELRNTLRNLKSRYSDQHPDVIKTQTAIAKLEKDLEAQKAEGGAEDAGSEGADYGAYGEGSLFAAQIEELYGQVRQVSDEMKSLFDEQQRISRELQVYQDRVESGPRLEQMEVDLMRGYSETQENYRELMDKKFKAKLAENLEVSQQGEQFRILDLAQLPDKPSKPQTRRLLGIGFFLALFCGFGLAFLMEYLDPSFLSSKQLEKDLKLPVLVSIPVIMAAEDYRSTYVRRAVSAAALVFMAAVLLCALYFLWKMDPMAIAFAAN